MADNVVLNSGAGGDTVAADALGGSIKHQQFLVEYGAAGTATRVDATHGLPVQSARTPTATLTNVTSSASTATILASNTSRLGAWIVNESTATLYLKCGATASLTSYSVAIGPGVVWELPTSSVLYTGILDGIWSAANGRTRSLNLIQ